MKQKSLKEILAEDAGSFEAVLTALEELSEELRRGETAGWENPTLLEFLEAMHAWLETMGPRVGHQPTWKFLEAMVRAAKIYE